MRRIAAGNCHPAGTGASLAAGRMPGLAGICYDPHDPRRSDVDLWRREITVRGKGARRIYDRVMEDSP